MLFPDYLSKNNCAWCRKFVQSKMVRTLGHPPAIVLSARLFRGDSRNGSSHSPFASVSFAPRFHFG
ncbi:hypothetical protein Pla144_02050 [Bythopirellula polymerisocia]|uniref:Uncharacterized protein n=1 Tax=Bythopirellula polymerisocia TaxID=2528003 RepID=A0A5C6D191_9BACT|nr:hypothetical protein Pla144_02050 [Bythopirellula polymerisocia]